MLIDINKKTSSFKIIRYYLKTRGLILFTAFYYIPVILTFIIISIINLFYLKTESIVLKYILSDKFLLNSLYFFMILICFLLLIKYFKRAINFFSKESWFISMRKAFIPAIIAFSLGFLAIFLIIGLFDILPEISFIKNWLKVPNEGFIILLDYIKDADAFKVIIWFFYIIVIIPLYEEIAFRGFLQDSIEKIFKKHNLDIIISALIFSLFHIFSLSNVIFAFVVGLFLSHQRKVNKSINISIWVHGFVNFTGLLSGIIFHYINN